MFSIVEAGTGGVGYGCNCIELQGFAIALRTSTIPVEIFRCAIIALVLLACSSHGAVAGAFRLLRLTIFQQN